MAEKMNTINDEDLIRSAFRVLDKRGTGTITTAEFRNLMTNIGDRLTDNEVRKRRKEKQTYAQNTHRLLYLVFTLFFFVLQFEMLIGEADKDGDGNLDYEEFVHLMTSSWYSMRKIEVAIDSMTRRTVAFDRIYC